MPWHKRMEVACHGLWTPAKSQNIDPQSMDYSYGLPIWTTPEWTMSPEFSY